jgi:TfoX/Sxy family transcriptional regulator of competence genes
VVESYLIALRALLAGLTPGLEFDAEITCKHFFGGAAAYADGRIFMTLTPVGLALKLPQALRAALIEVGGAPLRYFPDAPIKKDYAIAPEALTDDPRALAPWVRESVDLARASS